MESGGGLFTYEAYCAECFAVTEHCGGQCLTCAPVGVPRWSGVVPQKTADGVREGKDILLPPIARGPCDPAGK
jgi:hypothetical protein